VDAPTSNRVAVVAPGGRVDSQFATYSLNASRETACTEFEWKLYGRFPMSFRSRRGYAREGFATVNRMKPASRLSRNNPEPASIAAASLVPDRGTISVLRQAARACTACDLWKTATQTVFGEGACKVVIMIVGEQPGDQEDRVGRPFVGPAGKLLDEALAEVGIDRAKVYVTNVVKHFKWSASERGKRRIHKKPRQFEIEACSPWLEAELRAVKPKILVCMGATAAQALLGKQFSVTRLHGQTVESPHAAFAIATSILDIARDRCRVASAADGRIHKRFETGGSSCGEEASGMTTIFHWRKQ
jgi:uracil-DNA glycosylase